MTCSACTEELLHCHELVIEHHDGTIECTIDDCDVPVVLHRFHANCDEILGPCACLAHEQHPAAA